MTDMGCSISVLKPLLSRAAPAPLPGAPRGSKWTSSEAALDALAAGMLVTILLDLWRIWLGGIVDVKDRGLPWM